MRNILRNILLVGTLLALCPRVQSEAPLEACSFQLQWEQNPPEDNVNFYTVYRIDPAQPSLPPVKVGGVAATSFTTSLNQSGIFGYYVVAVNANGDSPPSATVFVKCTPPTPTVPHAPVNLVVVNVEPGIRTAK
jgi:hypothetical protein